MNKARTTKRKNGVGCPQCGRSDYIEVIASAVGVVDIDIDGDHVDEVTWNELRDVDIVEASSFTCRACGHHQLVEGDSELFNALNLKWH